MNVLFIIDTLNTGGKERRLLELLKGLDQISNIKCELIILSKNIEYKEIHDLNISIHYLERTLLKDIKLISKFITIINVSWCKLTIIVTKRYTQDSI